jgi:Uma2 family endonuclease
MSSVGTRLVGADDLLAWPDDGRRRELIDGRLHEMAPAGAEHGMVALRIGALLQQHVERSVSGRAFAAETGFVLRTDPDTVRAPDAAVVTEAHAQRVGPTSGYWPGAPDLAVEVVSPSDSYTDVHGKALGWLSAGTQVVLVVDPAARQVTVYRSPHDMHVLAGDDVVDCSDVMPGFAPSVHDLFPSR